MDRITCETREVTNVEKWSEYWRLKFNTEKSKVLSITRKRLSITRKRHPLVAEYLINSETLLFRPERSRGHGVFRSQMEHISTSRLRRLTVFSA